MKPLFYLRLFLDSLWPALLLVASAYDWLDNATHEIIGTAMFLLLVTPQHLQPALVRDGDAKEPG